MQRRLDLSELDPISAALDLGVRTPEEVDKSIIAELRQVTGPVESVGRFDPARVPDPTVPENLERENGRGLFVLRHLVDQVSFNEKGNDLCLILRAG